MPGLESRGRDLRRCDAGRESDPTCCRSSSKYTASLRGNGNRFAAREVLGSAPWPSSNLLALVRRGVIEKLDGSASDGGAFYRLVAPLGVERALRELTLL